MSNDDDNHSLFHAAVAALYSDTHQAMTRDAIRAAAARRTRTIDDMREYMNRIGLSSAAMMKDKHLIHITGTKGKGSTAAMCECICRHSNNGVWTTGLFTSPHLIDIRERIRINGKPVSKEIFAKAYWEIRHLLENYKNKTNGGDDDNLPILPGYFRMLTLLALFIFSHHQEPTINVIILEVGLGGRYDATNVLDMDWFSTKVACGVTLIDYDHCRILGESLEEIAWEKGGIFQVIKQQQQQGNESSSTISPRPLPVNYSTTTTTTTTTTPTSTHPSIQEQDDVIVNDTTITSSTITNSSGDGRIFYSLSSNTESVLNVLQTCACIEGRGGRLVTVCGSTTRKKLLQSSLSLRNVNDADQSSITTNLTSTSTTTTPSPPLALGLHGDHQWDNAALAIALCKHIMTNKPSSSSTITTTLDKDDEDDDSEMYQSLSHVTWPGRCQTIHHCNNRITFYVDGAHTVQSIKAGLEWFQQKQTTATIVEADSNNSSHDYRRRHRALLFNCSHEREPVQLLHLLLRGSSGGGHGHQLLHDDASTGTSSGSLDGFDYVFFCRSNSDRPSSVDKMNARDLLKAAGYPVLLQQDEASMTKTSSSRTWQDTLLDVWKYLVQHEMMQQEAKKRGSILSTNPAAAQVTASNLTALEAVRRLEDIIMANNNSQEELLSLSLSLSTVAGMDVFVTGSLYLAGSVLEALEWKEDSQTDGYLAF